MEKYTVLTRFANGVQQVIFLYESKPLHAKAFLNTTAGIDSFLYAVLDWTRDGKYFADECSVVVFPQLALDSNV